MYQGPATQALQCAACCAIKQLMRHVQRHVVQGLSLMRDTITQGVLVGLQEFFCARDLHRSKSYASYEVGGSIVASSMP